MSNDKMQILNNMNDVINKLISIKKYSEEYYFELYNLIIAYEKLNLNRNELIDKILLKNYGGYTLKEILRVNRNMYAHPDKINGENEYILLYTKVDIETINKLEYLIKSFVSEQFNNVGDIYTILKNNKKMKFILKFTNNLIHTNYFKNDFDKRICKKIALMFDEFNFPESSKDEWNNFEKKVTEILLSDDVRINFINLYGQENYDRFNRMITDDSFTEDEAIQLLKNIAESQN